MQAEDMFGCADTRKGGIPMGRPTGSFWKDESAMSAVEYSLLASLIALSVIGAVSSAGSVLRASYGNIADEIAID